MKRILGFMLYGSAVIVGLFVTLVLFFQILTTTGLMANRGKAPGLFTASFLFLFGAMLANFLFKLGHDVLQNKSRLGVGARIYLLMIVMAVDVAVFLKSAIPFLTQGHGVWSGSLALLSVITFAGLCWMLTRI
jgi:hypothetical protein